MPDSNTYSPTAFWTECFKTMAICIATGAILRQIAIYLESFLIDELSNAILFLPCTVAAIWVAWGLPTPPKNPWMTAGMVVNLLGISCICRFRIVSYPTLENATYINGYCSPISFWLALQGIHWLGFFATAAIVAKFIQWTTGVGISPTPSPPLKTQPLSINKLGLLITLCALICAAYQRWFVSLSPGIIRTEDSPNWHQFFPVGSRPWAAGLIGGLLLPVHWLAIASILTRTQDPPQTGSRTLNKRFLRQGLLALWCLAAAGLQIACSKLYFSNLIIPDGWNRWIEYSIGQPYNVAAIAYTADEPPLGFYLFKAFLQICLVLLAIEWIKKLGFRIAFYNNPTN